MGIIIGQKKNNLSILTRASDKVETEYLKTLELLGLNNGLLKYHFFADRIEISYFIAGAEDKSARDILLNKLALLEKAEAKIMQAMVIIKENRLKNSKNVVVYPQIMQSLLAPRMRAKKYSIAVSEYN